VSEQAPVVVIGSGPAGATAALVLGRAGVDTLLLEAGREESRLGFTARVRGLTVARHRPPRKRRGALTMAGDPATEIYEELAPGGLSNQWSGAVPRFSETDFEDAERAGAEYTWPIGYADLVPWYEAVEPLLCIAGGVTDAPELPAGKVAVRRRLGGDWGPLQEASEAIGRSTVVMPYAYGGGTFLTRSGTAFNAFTRLVKPAVRRGELSVRYDSRVVRLEWSSGERRVVAAICVDSGGSETRVPCRAVVLAAGAINSPQILLESTHADFPNGLGNECDVVGRYLHDHPLAKIAVGLGRSVSASPAAYITRSGLERTEPLYAAAFMQWGGTGALARSVLAARPGRAREIGFHVFGTMRPTRENFVALDGKARDGGPSSLRLSLRHPPEAGAALERARGDLLELLDRVGWQPRERVWVVEAPGNSVHYGGTCRMHASPEYGVVDAWSRVHGVPNVAVADSSVFTTGPEKNPVLTSMALAARAADRLAQEIRCGEL
jgi:choline dehydrogenase-like flavoprotein